MREKKTVERNFLPKIASVLAGILLLLCLPISTAAATPDRTGNFVVLGDSIAFGYNADSGYDYASLFYHHLQANPDNSSLTFSNLAQPNATSGDLLKKLQTDNTIRNALSSAKIVTVSIGGNNLLQPVINTLAEVYHLNPGDSQFITKLGNSLRQDPNEALTLLEMVYSSNLEEDLRNGVNLFNTDWAGIHAQLKSLAPEADIYVLNLYEPFSPQNPLATFFDEYVQAINATIQSGEGYRVANVYNQFMQHADQNPTHFDPMQENLDPHPTTQGHALIWQAILKTNANFDGGIIDFGSRIDVPTTKIWTVYFNVPIQIDPLPTAYVTVRDKKELPVNISIVPGNNGKTLQILPPPGGYAPGQTYYLNIFNGLKGENGLPMEHTARLQFTIKSNSF